MRSLQGPWTGSSTLPHLHSRRRGTRLSILAAVTADRSNGVARTRDGLDLHTLHWRAAGSPRAHLLLVHGIAEHASRHDHVASHFAAAGIETHAFDLRGFGTSSGARAYVEHWPLYHDDVEDQMAAIRASAGALPVVLYGHSMGGLIALGYVLADPQRPAPDLLVLSAPAIAAAVPAWKLMLADVLGRVLPRFAVENDLPAGGRRATRRSKSHTAPIPQPAPHYSAAGYGALRGAGTASELIAQ